MNIAHTFNKTCTIRNKANTENATTGQREISGSDYETGVPCRLDMNTGDERRTPKKIYEKATHLLTMGYREDLNYKDFKILLAGITYDILMITPGGGIKSHIELDLELVKS